jgi:hypothetical protein
LACQSCGGTRQLGPRTTRTETSRPVSEDMSARKRGIVGPYVKTTWTINNYCCLTYFFNKIDGNHKDTVWHLSTVLGNVKKNPYIINQNHIFFKKLLWSHFWIDFYKCYTKTFGIVYILIGYLLIMLLWVIFICT